MTQDDGLRLFPARLDRQAQEQLAADIAARAAEAPPYVPRMPRTGRPMSVRQTNFGALGWVTDQIGGYRYQDRHPETGRPWPAIPPALLSLWADVAPGWPEPEACLVNYYDPDARMGMHVDADEEAIEAPVVSVSLGDTAIFRIGGAARGDRSRSFRLASGDVLVLGGAARRFHHGVDRLFPGSSRLLEQGGRISLTLRRVRRGAREM